MSGVLFCYTTVMLHDKLLQQFNLISDQMERQELKVLLAELERLLLKDVPGSMVEFGCYTGTASLFIARMLHALAPDRTFHVYDSFEGLPEKSVEDQSAAGEQFKRGELAASKREFITNFKKANLKLPIIHKGWFSDVQSKDLPEQIAFAFLDGDYYNSVLVPLRQIWPLLSPGAVVIIDDYQNEALPGASKAVDEWLDTHTMARFRVEASLAIITLPAAQS